MKLCPWNSTLIHSVPPYTTGSTTFAYHISIASAPTVASDVTHRNFLHVPLITTILEFTANGEVVVIMSPLEFCRRLSQFFHLPRRYSPSALPDKIFFMSR